MSESDDKDKKKLPAEDQALWDSFAQDMLETQNPPEEEDFEKLLEESSVEEKPDHTVQKEEKKPIVQQKKPVSAQPAQLDRRTEEKLRKGKIPIEGRLDLHGLTQSKAYKMLCDFIKASAQEKKRCVLVITGKGKSKATSEDWLTPGQGVLKQKVPEWLLSSAFQQYVLKAVPAQPQHGGSGALYVYLKKQL